MGKVTLKSLSGNFNDLGVLGSVRASADHNPISQKALDRGRKKKQKTHKHFSDGPCGTIVPGTNSHPSQGQTGQNGAFTVELNRERPVCPRDASHFVLGRGPVCPRDGWGFVPDTVPPKMFVFIGCFVPDWNHRRGGQAPRVECTVPKVPYPPPSDPAGSVEATQTPPCHSAHFACDFCCPFSSKWKENKITRKGQELVLGKFGGSRKGGFQKGGFVMRMKPQIVPPKRFKGI